MASSPTLDEPFQNGHFESLSHAPCVSLFHRYGRVGCGTWDRGVMTGRLLHWSAVISVDEKEGGNGNKDGGNSRSLASSPTVAPYVAVVEEGDYTSETVAQLLSFSSLYQAGDFFGDVDQGGPLRGVLVLSSHENEVSYEGDKNAKNLTSPEPLTPQGDGTPMSGMAVGPSYEWNVMNNGDGLTMTDMYGLPTAYIPDSGTAEYLRGVSNIQAEAVSSKTSIDANVKVFPSIVAEFNYYMGPGNSSGNGDSDENTYTSKTCIEWRNTDGAWAPKCLPLGGNSIWAVAGTPLSLEYGSSNSNNEDDENSEENDDNSAANIDKSKPIILIATSIDSTSMFHDISPGANSAASNILALLLAAELIGSSIRDEVLDELYGRIVFSFFQGESYGFIGSRMFLKDVQEFQCQDDGDDDNGGNKGVASVYKRRDEVTTTRSCLHPFRPDLTFQNLGEVRGMISVDQVGNLGGGKTLYVQGGENSAPNDEVGFPGFLAEVMEELSGLGNSNAENDDNNGSGYNVQASSVAPNDQDDTYPLPPTPLSSLVQQSSGALGGIVLTGYDDAFVANSLYHSHLDSTEKYQSIDGDAIAAASTYLARAAVAAAYQNANAQVDAATAASYAMELLPKPASSNSDTFKTLSHCLLEDGNCDTFLNYGTVERNNDAQRTGTDLGLGVPLGTPPNYYVSVYDSSNGQGFVRASGRYYGSLLHGQSEDNDEVKSYGDSEDDVVLLRPSLLEVSIFGLLNDFLGRGSYLTSEDEGTDAPDLYKCVDNNDCSTVSYCNTSSSPLSLPTCAGGLCVCGSRSHYHTALDEAISPAANYGTGRFIVQDDDQGVSAMYTEPYWSNSVGVRIYRDAGKTAGIWASSMGCLFGLMCAGLAYRLKNKLVKEKVY